MTHHRVVVERENARRRAEVVLVDVECVGAPKKIPAVGVDKDAMS